MTILFTSDNKNILTHFLIRLIFISCFVLSERDTWLKLWNLKQIFWIPTSKNIFLFDSFFVPIWKQQFLFQKWVKEEPIEG